MGQYSEILGRRKWGLRKYSGEFLLVRVGKLFDSNSRQTLPDRAHLDIALSESGTTLYTASADRTVSLIDVRAESSQSATKTLSHPSAPSCLAVHPSSTHHLLTGAHDGVLRVWDVRSPRVALSKFEHTVQGKDGSTRKGKILGVDWAHGLAVCAGEVGFSLWQAGVGGNE